MLAAALIFLLFVASAPKREYLRIKGRERLAQQRMDVLEKELNQRKQILRNWEATLADLQSLREKNLYSGDDALFQIRLDLEKIFQANNMIIPDLEYEYESFPDSGLGLIKLGFIMTTDYNRLKRFIYAVESFPRFLMLEKIDFLEIDSGSGRLRLRLQVAGWYE